MILIGQPLIRARLTGTQIVVSFTCGSRSHIVQNMDPIRVKFIY